MVGLCPELAAQGICSAVICQYRHDLHICDECNAFCVSDHVWQMHLNGRRHKARVSGKQVTLCCSLCNENIIGPTAWSSHIASKRHNKKATQLGVSAQVEPQEGGSSAATEYCNQCLMVVPRKAWSRHLDNTKHKAKERFGSFKAKLNEAEKDKHGILVSGELNFGVIELARANVGVSASISIQTSVPVSRVSIVEVKLSSATSVNQSSPFSVNVQNTTLVYGRTITGQVYFKPQFNGRYDDRIEIIFEDELLHQRFAIVRPVKAIVGSQADHDLLRPIAPFIPRKRTTRAAETDVLPGLRPPALNAIPYVVKLADSKIPETLSKALSNGSLSETIGKVQRMFIPSAWDKQSYSRHFKNLIWVEEYKSEQDLEMYDIYGTTLTRNGYFYHLDVPGLAENRPSVMVGDKLLVQRQDGPANKWFEGYVHFVRQVSVGLRFHTSFKGDSLSQKYNVRFKLNRIPLRRQHQALDTAFALDRFLLPTRDHLQSQTTSLGSLRILRTDNPLIGKNALQLQAVQSIVLQRPGSVPFIVFGPPGTGKTVTIVEAIRQVLKQNPSARIMACAPSNSAADLIASRLTDLGSATLFRLYAPSRNKDLVPDELLSFTVKDSDGHFTIPPKPTMHSFRVVVSTCVSGCIPYGTGMPRGHFSHLFFDEAGQATEPEVMIAIKTMADNATNIILSGDPKQLGPIIRSNVARKLGLEKSYLERLMEREIYDETGPNYNTVVKLVKNFRSHDAILKFPNEQFYRGELQQCGDPLKINAFINSTQLVNKKFPIVFHALSGKDDREASSPSFFNIDEATQVKAYIEALRSSRQIRLTDQDIGVIAPYHAQCKKIRTLLRSFADGVKVGSVEEFQGQERKVIIISTVRSSREFVSYDLKHTLGFVANPRRFNVAVTRAQALLIVIGDPVVLSLDPLWRSFLNYVYDNNGWKGPPPTWDTTAPVMEDGGYDNAAREAGLADMNDFTRRMESLIISEMEEASDEDRDANVDRPWRETE